MVAGSDQQRPPPDTEPPEQVARHGVVRAAEERDDNSRQDECGRRQPVGGESVAGAEAEGKRDEDDEQEGRDDLADTWPALSLGIEVALSEDEQRDQDQEWEPVGFRLPQRPPVDAAPVVDLAE